jgi:hypothetical protein
LLVIKNFFHMLKKGAFILPLGNESKIFVPHVAP